MAADSGRTPTNLTSLNNDNEDDSTFRAAGIDAINNRIRELYPDQWQNHLQATALMKYWLNGPDPLDYISMLLHRGDPSQGIVEHWHYISFGFSDLHGDGRVHQFTGAGQQSGFGFELTFRLKRQPGEVTAPMWPSNLMNALAKYVFRTGNMLNCGDHIPWHKPLDGQSQSAIQHMLIVEDPQCKSLDTPYGSLQFRQIVGATEGEMKTAQRWKGSGVLNILSKVPESGGPFYVTDMSRQLSVFEMHPQLMQVVGEHIQRDGSNLGHVTSVCCWEDPASRGRGGKQQCDDEEERDLASAHIKFDLEAAELLPLVVKGRLLQGRYFVFQNVAGQVIIFSPPEFQADMVMVDSQHPLKSQGHALQIFCSKEYSLHMAKEFEILQSPTEVKNCLPKVFRLNSPNITITVHPVKPGTGLP